MDASDKTETYTGGFLLQLAQPLGPSLIGEPDRFKPENSATRKARKCASSRLQPLAINEVKKGDDRNNHRQEYDQKDEYTCCRDTEHDAIPFSPTPANARY